MVWAGAWLTPTLPTCLPPLVVRGQVFLARKPKLKDASCAHKMTLYEIKEKLGKNKQAMHDVVQGLYFTECPSWKPDWSMDSSTPFYATAISAKISKILRKISQPCINTH